jgi:polysaccharide deacetylase family protein (PEP-CTERM system associated)
MLQSLALPTEVDPVAPATTAQAIILSFDVEEHYRIEAASHLNMGPEYRRHCRERVDVATRGLLDMLEEAGARATFFIVGQIARDNPRLVRDIAAGGHEVASHGWDHQRVHRFTPATFREDLRQSKDTLEQVTGQAVVGYRAPTFSVMRQTAWALDVLAEEGMQYDSSIYPVRHDRYGVPDAPRSPFLARGREHTLLELPPVTLRMLGTNVPMGGGGYFRLFPLFLTRWAVRQTLRQTSPAVAMLYFHPWEFDPEQEQMPLGLVSRFRTYVGVRKTRGRLKELLTEFPFSGAADVARQMDRRNLPVVDLASQVGVPA